MDGLMDGWTDGWRNRWRDARINKLMNKGNCYSYSFCSYVIKDEWMDGGWMKECDSE